jgi:hypothetical protein
MDERITDLLGVIKKEINLYRDMVGHAREKTALLSEGRVEAIQESNKVEETFNIKLRFLENELKRLSAEICRSLGITHEEWTLEELAEHLEKPAAAELKSQIDLFRTIVIQLNDVTKRNLELIETSLKYSNGLLALFSNATGPYQQTGLFQPIPDVQPTFSHRA